jgi:hypothetical protein
MRLENFSLFAPLLGTLWFILGFFPLALLVGIWVGEWSGKWRRFGVDSKFEETFSLNSFEDSWEFNDSNEGAAQKGRPWGWWQKPYKIW